MAYVKAAVYDPPSNDLPHVAIVFDPQGGVLVARTVPSVAAGEALLVQVMGDFQAKIDADLGARRGP